jgi:hypothetical protein
MKTWLLPGLVLGLAIAAPLFTVACASDDDSTEGANDDEIKKKKLGLEGDPCNAQKACKEGLLCKAQSSGPPPGAVGLPAPTITCGGPPPNARCTSCPNGYKQYNGEPSCDCCASSGPPPGAVGLPAPQPDGTCQKPGPGELGGTCGGWDNIQCNPGLTCVYTGGTGGGLPPGAMGMPAPQKGTCKAVSGPPPGAVGLPQR